MELTTDQQNTLCPQSPSSTKALTLEGQRSVLLLPQVSKLATENSQNHGDSWDKCFMMFENNKDESFNSAKKNNVIQNKAKDQMHSHSSHGYNPEYSIKATHPERNNNDDVFKGSNSVIWDLAYVSPGSSGKAYDNSRYDDQVSGEKNSSINNRIHKTPVARQDSVAFDITLGSPDETTYKNIKEIKRLDGNGQTEELQRAHNQNNIKHVHRGLQENSSYSGDRQHQQNLTKQTLPSGVNITPSSVNGNMHDKNQLFSKSFVDSERRQFAQEIIHQTCNHAGSEQVNNRTQPDKEFMRSNPVANVINSNESKSTNSTKQKYGFDMESDTTWRLKLPSFQQFVQYVTFLVLIALAILVIQLHTRVTALESSTVSSSAPGCQCDKKIQAQESQFSDKRNHANSNFDVSSDKDSYEHIMNYFDNENQEPSADVGAANDASGNQKIRPNEKHPIFKGDQKNSKSIHHRMQTGDPSLLRHFKSKDIITNAGSGELDLADNVPDLSSSTNKKHAEGVMSMRSFPGNNFGTADTFHKTNDVRLVEVADSTMSVGGKILSRQKRTPRRENDPKFAAKQRKLPPKQAKHEGRNAGPQVETFDVPFFDIFDYSTYFRTTDPASKHKDCTTRHNWPPGIEACKDSRVVFPEKHSILPFYHPTNATSSKDVKKRMITTDASGRFHVNVPGDYLFQQNITIVAESEMHFLALYVNGQATYACQHGGFVCPHTNDDKSSKYKVCSILGVLELKKDDILDIRTMESHMTVRSEVHKLRKSYIKFILLNKLK